jgi:hypothetical protein
MELTEANTMILTFGPYLIMIMLVLLSIFNSSLKGIVYLFGVIILFMIVKALSALKGENMTIYINKVMIDAIKNKKLAVAAALTNKVNEVNKVNEANKALTNKVNETTTTVKKLQSTTLRFTIDPFNAALYIFTITYLLLPMLEHGTFNVPLLIFLVCIYSHYMISMVSGISAGDDDDKTSPMPILFLSSLVGLIGGGFYYVFLAGNNETKQFLYYNEFNSSNRVACMRPSKTNFKCRLYKNGELVQ